MRSRWLIISLILFETLWLNVIVPGHQRGMIVVPGATAGTATRPACCCSDGSASPAERNNPTPEDRVKHCAICYFSAGLGLPPIYSMDLAELGLLQRVRAARQHDLFARMVLMPFDACGPPTRA